MATAAHAPRVVAPHRMPASRSPPAVVVLRFVVVVSLLRSSLPSSSCLSLFFLAERLRVRPGVASGLRGSPVHAASAAELARAARLARSAYPARAVRSPAPPPVQLCHLHFEKDKALARRFQPVLVNEPSQEDAVKILLGLREKYETYHKCKYTLEGINAAVYLSARYIPDRYLPDKAIDLIDEAGSRAQMESFKRKKEEQCSILSKSPDEYWQEIRAVQSTHEVVMQCSWLKYSLDENDKEDGVNIEVIGDNKIASPSMPPTLVDE
eukprot:XP_020395525.1 chaperone protein ClpD2, chloroplastic [Zea mays]